MSEVRRSGCSRRIDGLLAVVSGDHLHAMSMVGVCETTVGEVVSFRDRYDLTDDERTLVYFEAVETDVGYGFRIWRIERTESDRFYFVHPATGRVRIDVALDVARLLSKLSAMQC